MDEFGLVAAVLLLRGLIVVQLVLLARSVADALARDASVRPRFGFLACAECAICFGVTVAALLSTVDPAFWPMVVGLALLANVSVALVRWRLVLVGERVLLVVGHAFARDGLSCAFRGVSLHVDTGGRFFAVPFPIARLDALVEELGATVL